MDLEAIKVAVIDFIREHQAWAPFVVGALAFAESIAFLSLLAPAIVILVALGPVIVTAGLDFRTIWLGAALGAALGDALSYWIGWRNHAALAFSVLFGLTGAAVSLPGLALWWRSPDRTRPIGGVSGMLVPGERVSGG